ncbi:MAG: hypothetical protein QG578_2141, partial [Thermodesulfobacteriota bacterium]|nr:hypothetical protein [Thermodesulfobacteriota bacterium]
MRQGVYIISLTLFKEMDDNKILGY